MNEEELQNPDNWDLEHAEKAAPAARKARAVVSVAFPGEDFESVAKMAERLGMKTSEFIRVVTLGVVRGSVSQANFVLVSGGQQEEIYIGDAQPSRAVASRVIRDPWIVTGVGVAAATSGA